MPTWKRTVSVAAVFHNDELGLPEKGKAIVAAFRAKFPEGEDLELDGLLEELGDAAEEGDVDWFDAVWGGVYDWADSERVWVETGGL